MSNGRTRVKRISPPIWLYDYRFTNPSVGSTPTLILPADPFRVSWIICCTTTANITIWPHNENISPFGINLGANGGWWECKWETHPILCGMAWYGVDPFGGGTVRIAENLAVR